MRILISIGALHPAYGGPFYSVGQLARHLVLEGHEVEIVTADYPHLPAQNGPDGVPVTAIPAKILPFIRQSYIPQCGDVIDSIISRFRPEIIHDNGMWLTLNHEIAKAAHRHKLPRIVSPRGTIDPWAIRHRRIKKQVALLCYQKKDLELVSSFHAASQLEVESIRKMGLSQPIAMIPNGVELPEVSKMEDGRWKIQDKKRMLASEKTENRKSPNSQLPTSTALPGSGTRYALYIGRLHPVKNLPVLIESWAKIKPEGWVLRIVGSDEEAHESLLKQLVNKLGIQDKVVFCGPVYGKMKEKLIEEAELAFLVSHSENFGIAAAEALAAGVPVIASKTTPWECLETRNAGWWVEGSVAGISEALRYAVELPREGLITIGENGRQLVKEQFDWSIITQNFLRTYENLILKNHQT